MIVYEVQRWICGAGIWNGFPDKIFKKYKDAFTYAKDLNKEYAQQYYNKDFGIQMTIHSREMVK